MVEEHEVGRPVDSEILQVVGYACFCCSGGSRLEYILGSMASYCI